MRIAIGIIGLGPRGLGIMERIVAFASVRGTPIDLHLIDPREHGQGSHSPRQSDHLLINSVASQITMFTDGTVNLEGPSNPGPSLAEWARKSGVRRVGARFFQLDDPSFGEPIDDNDYVPRSMLGDYLSWAYDEIVRRAADTIAITQYKMAAVDLDLERRGLLLRLASGYTIRLDFLFLTTGHGENAPDESDQKYMEFVEAHQSLNPALNYFRSAYPIEKFDLIPPSATVALQGMGLTAHDVISELTVGRRGRFVRAEGEYEYRPSGREPTILLYSRQGVPFSARGKNQKGSDGLYIPRFFTEDWAENLRKSAGKLNFHQDIFPVLFKEMAYAYRCAREGQEISVATYAMGTAEIGAVHSILNPLRGHIFRTQREFREFARAYVVSDLDHARRGNVSDPIKAATDLLRDARDVLRYLIEWGGLTGDSHSVFDQSFATVVNRVAVGPPILRNEELLALMAAGIVRFAGGPTPKVELAPTTGKFVIKSHFLEEASHDVADVIVRARIDPAVPEMDLSPLMRNLAVKGLVRPFVNEGYKAGGIDIDRGNHPIDQHGRPNSAIWALGSIVEGANYFTYVLPRPNVNSRFLRDTDRCVADLFVQIARAPRFQPCNNKGGTDALREHQDHPRGGDRRAEGRADQGSDTAPC